jgi:YegS/Rv2252/BmrU family lipid kinase
MRRQWPRIASNLKRALGDFEHVLTAGPGDATRLVRWALSSGFDQVVAVGGDGTISEAACGFFDGGKPISPDAVLGILAAGTGCDFVRTSHGASTIEAASERLAHQPARLIDVGKVSFVDRQKCPAERIFVNVVSFGCGGAVVDALSTSTKRFGRRAAFFLTTAAVLLRYRDQTVDVAVDGNPPEHLTITNYAVCNGRYFGRAMQVAPRAELDDGFLDITIWSGFRLKDFILKSRLIFDGTHVNDPGTRVLRGKRVSASSNESVLLDIDGEPAGYLPITIEIIPRALRVRI